MFFTTQILYRCFEGMYVERHPLILPLGRNFKYYHGTYAIALMKPVQSYTIIGIK